MWFLNVYVHLVKCFCGLSLNLRAGETFSRAVFRSLSTFWLLPYLLSLLSLPKKQFSLSNDLKEKASLLIGRSLLLTLLKLFSATIIEFLQGGLRFPAFQPFLLSPPSRGTKSMVCLNRHAGNGKGVDASSGTAGGKFKLTWVEALQQTDANLSRLITRSHFHKPWCSFAAYSSSSKDKITVALWQ